LLALLLDGPSGEAKKKQIRAGGCGVSSQNSLMAACAATSSLRAAASDAGGAHGRARARRTTDGTGPGPDGEVPDGEGSIWCGAGKPLRSSQKQNREHCASNA